MFWKKDKEGAAASAVEATHKDRKVTPKEVMMEQIDATEPGQEITFRLGEIYVKPFITVVHNAQGKKYTVFQDGKDAEGKPAGARGKLWDTNHSKEIVKWIMDRDGTLYPG